MAIENARLFEEAHRKQDCLAASTEITRQLLSSEGDEPLHVIARRLQLDADADAVNVVLPTPDGQRLMVEVATGAGAEQVTAMTYSTGGTASQAVLTSGRAILIVDYSQQHEHLVHLSEAIPVGPLMVLPLGAPPRVRGALVVARLHGRARFSAADLDMAATFANHAAVALELADARTDQQRLVLLEDRDRIARDLHDHVIQRLFAAGLTIESVAAGLGADPRADRLAQVVIDVDATIRQIRDSIFQLRGPLAAETAQPRTRLFVLAVELTPLPGFEPRVSFAGPVDAVRPRLRARGSRRGGPRSAHQCRAARPCQRRHRRHQRDCHRRHRQRRRHRRHRTAQRPGQPMPPRRTPRRPLHDHLATTPPRADRQGRRDEPAMDDPAALTTPAPTPASTARPPTRRSPCSCSTTTRSYVAVSPTSSALNPTSGSSGKPAPAPKPSPASPPAVPGWRSWTRNCPTATASTCAARSAPPIRRSAA